MRARAAGSLADAEPGGAGAGRAFLAVRAAALADERHECLVGVAADAVAGALYDAIANRRRRGRIALVAFVSLFAARPGRARGSGDAHATSVALFALVAFVPLSAARPRRARRSGNAHATSVTLLALVTFR